MGTRLHLFETKPKQHPFYISAATRGSSRSLAYRAPRGAVTVSQRHSDREYGTWSVLQGKYPHVTNCGSEQSANRIAKVLFPKQYIASPDFFMRAGAV